MSETGSRAITVGGVTAASVTALYGGELLAWTLLGRSGDALAIGVATAVCAATSGVLAAALVRFQPPLVAIGVGAVVPLVPAAAHLADRIGFAEGPGAAAMAAVLAASGAAVLALALSRRWLARAMLGAGTLSLIASIGVILPERPETRAVPARRFPDVVLLVMDTTRRDHLGVYGYGRQTSPALERFARAAEVYEDAWSVAPWTPSSHASMFTGLLPAEHGVGGQNPAPLPASLITLPRVLRDAGYRTAGFPANPNLAAPGWSQGFDVYHPPWFTGPHSLVRWLNLWLTGGRPAWLDGGTTPRALARARRWWQRSAGAPRFLFVNLIDPHDPYRPPEPERQRFLPGVSSEQAFAVEQSPMHYQVHRGIDPGDREVISSLYDAEIAAMDREIGAFVDWLEARGELDSTLFAITSDHGERLGERGTLGHLLQMDQHLLRVPLLVRYPPRLAGGRIPERVRLDGLPGYLLWLVGIEAPAVMAERALHRARTQLAVAQHRYFGWYVDQLREREDEFDARPYRGNWIFVADRDHALVWSPQQGPDSHQLFALGDDPDWEADLSEILPDKSRRLLAAALALPLYEEAVEDAPEPLDPEARERLRSLGYLD